MNRIQAFLRTLFFCGVFLVSAPALSAAPELINFQGKLSDAAGVPLSGQYGVTFSVYDAQLGGNLLWSEHRGAVDVNRGLFSVPLGELAAQAPSTVFTGGDQWLEVQLDGDTPMVPRQRIGSVAYSFHANVADEVVNELDPTVPASLKDGVAWNEVSGIPADFADGIDHVGLTTENDPRVGAVTAGEWCRGSGDQVVCDQPAPTDTLAGLNCSVDQIARYDGSAWVCADPSNASGSGGAAGGARAAKAHLPSDFWLPSSVQTPLPMRRIVYDTHGDFDSARGRYVASVAGIYHADFGAQFKDVDLRDLAQVSIIKNGSITIARDWDVSYYENHDMLTVVSADVELAAGDYIEFYAYSPSGTLILRGPYSWANVHSVVVY